MGISNSKLPPGLLPSDRIVVIIGPTGAGKSAVSMTRLVVSNSACVHAVPQKFINTAAGEDRLQSARGLAPVTKEVAYVRCSEHEHSPAVVFVDTPAFPDPEEERREADEKEIEKKIRTWVKKSYKKQKVEGILYLYKISDNRMTEPPYPNYQMFRKLIGDNFHTRVLLVTTMWETVSRDVGEQRKERLGKNWEIMIMKGSSIECHDGTRESAWRIVNNLLKSS